MGITWKAPTTDFIKINVHGSARGNPREAAIGGIGRSSTGDWVFGFAGKIDRNLALTAELEAKVRRLASGAPLLPASHR